MALEQAGKVRDRMRVAIGLHPHEAGRLDTGVMEELEQLARREPVVAIGEIGLDYHYMMSSRSDQLVAFRQQVELAVRLNLPVVVHSRDAEAEVLDILAETRDRLAGGVLHCYTGSLEEAGRAMDLSLFISFTGIVTFGDGSLDELVRYVPLDCLLLETDSPYLAPVPHRGRTNTPAFLPIITRRIAELKGMGVEEVVSAASRNAEKLFGLGTR